MDDIKPRTMSGQARRAPAPLKKRHGNYLWWVVAVVALVLLIGGGICWYVLRNNSQVDSSKYQAVFLENNQVYFGKLHAYNTSHPYLKDVWYIQNDSSSSDTSGKAATPQSSLQLTQLTKSVHGPEDEMLLNKSQILFVENLSSDSQVTKLINSNK